MPNVVKRTISLPQEHSAYIDKLVSEGDYASVSEVMRAGLRALQARDAAMERWLDAEVGAVFDRLAAEPGDVIPASDVFAEIRTRHAEPLAERE